MAMIRHGHGYLLGRLVLATLILAVTGMFAPLAGATLKPRVVVHESVVRLGDIFEGAEVRTDKIIANAPAPGRRLVLEAMWLYRIARANRIAWRPATRGDRVIVERASTVIRAPRIAATIKEVLASKLGDPERLEVELENKALQLHLPTDVPATVVVKRVDLDRRTRRFAALVLAPDERPEALRTIVAGRYYRLVEVPVLARRMHPGEIIREGDLEWITMRAEKIDRTAYLDARKIVGMSPRRVLSPERPIRSRDIRPPILVSRGSLVTMVYRTPKMTLTARGRAVEDGAKGETIRVVNTTTSRTVEAIVTANGMVKVVPLDGPVAIN